MCNNQLISIATVGKNIVYILGSSYLRFSILIIEGQVRINIS